MLNFPGIAKYSDHPLGAVDVTVAFHDVDAMHVTWHGNYIKYFEIARCSVLQKIDYDYPQMQASGYAWPIVDMRSRHVLSTGYGDQLQVVAVILEWDFRLVIKYFVLKKSTNKVVARGSSMQVPLCIKTMSMDMSGIKVIREKVENWHIKNSNQC